MCGFCCRNKEQGAVYSTPVVVTSETHQAPGSNYVVHTDHTTTVSPMVPPQNMPMPYPAAGGAFPPYPPTQPIQPYPPANVSSPYPPQAPYPMATSAPYPTNYPPQAMAEPPSYSDVVTQNAPYPQQSPYPQQAPYSQQSPYNPSYKQ